MPWLGTALHGRLACHWEQAINQLNQSLIRSGCQVTVQMTQTVWDFVLSTWNLCNMHLHNDAGQLSLPNYKQAMMTMYEQGLQLPPATQEALFQCPL